jgi:hypothetical protein
MEAESQRDAKKIRVWVRSLIKLLKKKSMTKKCKFELLAAIGETCSQHTKEYFILNSI